MSEQQNIEAIQQIYAAFGRGDIPYILDQLSSDVKWTCHLDPVVPWDGDFSGRPVEFFQAIDDSVDVLGFEPGEYIAQGDAVVSLGTFACRAKSTGKSANTKWIFVWKLANGKVASYEQFHDPAIAAIFS
jgi:ketosteroid isomerase-like protein